MSAYLRFARGGRERITFGVLALRSKSVPSRKLFMALLCSILLPARP